MTPAPVVAAHQAAARPSGSPDYDSSALPGVLAAMIDQYAPTLGEHVVRTQLERCQHDLAGVPPASLPEMAYRLAQERLADLVGIAPGPDEVRP